MPFLTPSILGDLIVIRPVFASEADRLLFLSRLWGVSLTAQDVADWEAYKLTRPVKLITETHSEYSQRRMAWEDGSMFRKSRMILRKWEGYGLGKVKAEALAWLSTRPTPNRTQARQAILLQLQAKWVDKLLLVDATNDLLPIVIGIIW